LKSVPDKLKTWEMVKIAIMQYPKAIEYLDISNAEIFVQLAKAALFSLASQRKK